MVGNRLGAQQNVLKLGHSNIQYSQPLFGKPKVLAIGGILMGAGSRRHFVPGLENNSDAYLKISFCYLYESYCNELCSGDWWNPQIYAPPDGTAR